MTLCDCDMAGLRSGGISLIDKDERLLLSVGRIVCELGDDVLVVTS